MKKLNIKNKEIQLLVLFGVLTFLFISVNSNIFLSSGDNSSNQGPYNFESDFPSTSAISISIVSPVPNDNFSVTAPDFVVEINDDVDTIDKMWYNLNGGANIMFMLNGTIDPNNWTALADGPVTLTFYANNSASEVDFESVSINKDTSVPLLVVNLPANNTVIVTQPLISVTVNDVNADKIWYSENSNIIFLTNSTPQLLDQLIWNSIAEGAFTIELFANDTAGNLNNFYTLNLIKDISAPIVDIRHPLPNAPYGIDAPIISLTINDATLNTTWYSIVGTNYTIEFTAIIGINNITIDQDAWNSLSEGEVTIIFYANDSLGRESSDSITLEKDLPEVFDWLAFFTDPIVLTIIGVVIAIVVVTIILVRRRKFHRTSDKEVQKIESLWD
jgi:hypothetical protein